MILHMRGSNAQQLAYWYVSVDNLEVGVLYSTNGVHVTTCVPLAKGKQISTSASSNSVTTAYVTPINK